MPPPKKSPLKSYPYQEVLKETTRYFQGDTLAANVWINKYSLKTSDGEIFELTPYDMHHRIAKEIARIERHYPHPISEAEIFDLIKDFRYIVPQGSPMAGIGNNFQIASLSNCFVIGIENPADSYGGIMKIDEEQVQLMKRRGGVGHDLSHIRPKGSPVKNSALTSTGVVHFMERYSNSTREVAQDGRRGALMLSVSAEHPDVEDFIEAKMIPGKITGANVSVKVSDEFMNAVTNHKKFVQKFPCDSLNPQFKKEIEATKLWAKIIHNAWQSAEPGVLFWDTIISESVPDCYADLGFKTVSTNPCGEIPLCPYDSCRLIALNLYSYVKNPFTQDAYFDFALFKKHVHYTQKIMDDIIDLELEKIEAIIEKIDRDPEPDEVKFVEKNLWTQIKRKTILGRRTGIGITAEGDMLAALGYRYGSNEAISFSIKLHKTLALEAYHASVNLAKQRKPFPLFSFAREKNNPFIKRIAKVDPTIIQDMKKYGRRNIALLTIAPTGSVSICTQTTSGLEPAFLVAYKRRRKINPNDKHARVAFIDELGDSWEEYNVFHPKFTVWLKINGYDPAAVSKLDDRSLKQIIKKSPYYKATANDVDWVAKVRMQGEIQKWVDHSISVTVNVPKDISEKMVDEIYKTAWKSGCKGMTIYREGSRAGVLIAKEESLPEKSYDEIVEKEAPPRPKVLDAEIVRFQNDYERWIAVVGLLKGKPYEIFTGKADEFFVPHWVEQGWVIKEANGEAKSRYDFQFVDKAGYKTTVEGLSRSFNKEFWNYAKLISGVLRHGMPLPHVISLVSGLNLNSTSINTWKNGVQRALKMFVPDGTKADGEICFQCKAKDSLIYQEGCLVCKNCGQSKCG